MPASGKKTWDIEVVPIRRMLASDAQSVVSLLQESPEATMWSKQGLEESTAEWIAWVAERNGKIVGFLIGRPAADEFEILNLAVGKEFRRGGIATKLIHSAIESARSAGALQIFLEVRSSNSAGIALYTRLAFHECGRRKNYYRDPLEDGVLMTLNLT